jgi:hypothetical protein
MGTALKQDMETLMTGLKKMDKPLPKFHPKNRNQKFEKRDKRRNR